MMQKKGFIPVCTNIALLPEFLSDILFSKIDSANIGEIS